MNTKPIEIYSLVDDVRRTFGAMDHRDVIHLANICEKLLIENTNLHNGISEALALVPKEKRESAFSALIDACHIVWNHKTVEHAGCQNQPHFWSIPADRDRDVDLRIGDTLQALDKMCEVLCKAVEQGGK